MKPVPPMRSIFRRHAGLTLVECLLASVILALIGLAVAQALLAGMQQSEQAVATGRAVALGQAIIEEIASLPQDSAGNQTPGPDGGESRTAFNHADDYHGLEESAGHIRNVAGELYPSAYQNFSRQITLSRESLTISGLTQTLSGLTVTVTVSDAKRTITQTRFLPERGE